MVMPSEGFTMIQAAHVVLYSREPEQVRAFFRDVLQFPAVDADAGGRSSRFHPRSWLCTRTMAPKGISFT